MSLSTYCSTTKYLFSSLFTIFRPSPSIESQAELIEGMEDGKLYIEDVRAFFGFSRDEAVGLCARGVKSGYLKQNVALLCPNCRRVIYEDDSLLNVPLKIVCENCQDLDAPEFEFGSSKLDKMVFYSLANYVQKN